VRHAHVQPLRDVDAGDARRVCEGFTYLPGSLLLPTPFRLLYGDVRYGLLAALLIAAIALRRLFHGRTGLVARCLALTIPGTIFAVERSWLEPLLFMFIVLALLAWQRDRLVLNVLAIAGAFALPWFIASPAGFYDNAAKYFFDMPLRGDALSVFPIAPTSIRAILPLVALVLMYAVVWLRVPRTAPGFLIGAGLILAGFELTNKISFYNEWALPSMTLLAGAMGASRKEFVVPTDPVPGLADQPLHVALLPPSRLI